MQLELLILMRLATIKSLAPGDLKKQLRPLVPVEDAKQALDEGVRALVAAAMLEVRPLRITDRGRARVAEALGVDLVPSWREVRNRHLPALVLGIPPTAARDLRAAVVAHLLVKHLGLSPRGSDPEQLIELAVATTLKVPRADATTLQAALVRRWVAEQPLAAAPPRSPPVPTPAPPVVVTAPRRWTDDEVLAAVRMAMARVPAAGRYGDDRVFVSAIWRQLDQGAAFPGLTFDGLKKLLVAANRRQQLTLARADLVGAMDAREVAASEIRYLNSTFHFVVDR